MSAERTETIITPDGTSIAVSLFEPAQPNGRTVLINAAMGVKRSYYSKYAVFLASHGFTVITYDYRGIGDSAPAKLRGYKAHLWQWGAEDQTALMAWILKQFPQNTLSIVGHSVGGQLVGLTPLYDRVSSVLGVAAQSGYWRGWHGTGRVMMLALWYGVIPVACAVFGYLPGRLFGSGEDVPAGVAREWAQAGKMPGYVSDRFRGEVYHHFEEVRAKMCFYSFSDDSYAPRIAVENLMQLYPNASKTHRHVSPQEVHAQKIGHFGFFRSVFESTLWAESAAWLKEN